MKNTIINFVRNGYWLIKQGRHMEGLLMFNEADAMARACYRRGFCRATIKRMYTAPAGLTQW